MKIFLTLLAFISFPSLLVAEEGHSHGVGGELEHALPIIGILVAIMIIGGIYTYVSNKKE